MINDALNDKRYKQLFEENQKLKSEIVQLKKRLQQYEQTSTIDSLPIFLK